MDLAPLLGFSEKLVTEKEQVLQPQKALPSKAMSGRVVPAPICPWPSLQWIGQSSDAGVRGPGKSSLVGGVRWSGLSSQADVCGRVFVLHASCLGYCWGAELAAKSGQQVWEEPLKRSKVITVQSQKNQAQVHLTSN